MSRRICQLVLCRRLLRCHCLLSPCLVSEAVFVGLPICVGEYSEVFAGEAGQGSTECVQASFAVLPNVARSDVDVVCLSPGADVGGGSGGDLSGGPVGELNLLIEPGDAVAVDP